MPRNSSGNYVLPAGNPVVADTLIETAWANPTMADIAAALTDSLDRYGRGGMLAEFKVSDGVVTAPGLAFLAQSNTGVYRKATSTVGIAAGGLESAAFSGSDIQMQQPTTFAGTIAVTGAATFADTINVTGAATFAGGMNLDALTVTGATHLNTLTADGAVTMLSTLGVAGKIDCLAAADIDGLATLGAAAVVGNFGVGGTSTFTGLAGFGGGAVMTAGQFLVTDGSLAAPGLAFGAAANTGLWRIGTASVGLALNGRDAFRFISTTETIQITSAQAGQSATLSLAGNGTTTGTSSFDITCNSAGSALVWNRADTLLAFGVNNVARLALTSSQAQFTVPASVGTSAINAQLTVDASNTGRNPGWFNATAVAQSYTSFATGGTTYGVICDGGFGGGPNGFMALRGQTGLQFSAGAAESARVNSTGLWSFGVTAAPQFSSRVRIEGGLELAGSTQLNVHGLASGTTPFEIINRTGGGFSFYSSGSIHALRLNEQGNSIFGPVNTALGAVTVRSNGTTTLLVTQADTATIAVHQYWKATGVNRYTSDVALLFEVANDPRFLVMYNGGIKNYSGNDLPFSDARVKRNLAEAGPWLEKIRSIPVKVFQYAAMGEGSRYVTGVTAQDVEAVAPELVPADTTDLVVPGEGGEPVTVAAKSIYTSDLAFGVMKALQELADVVDFLDERVAELEGAG